MINNVNPIIKKPSFLIQVAKLNISNKVIRLVDMFFFFDFVNIK